MFFVEEEARPILQKANDEYSAKFNDDLPIIKLLSTNHVDKTEALRILDLVEKAIEDNKSFGDYDPNIFY